MPASDLPAARMTWKGRLLRRLVRWKARTPSAMARYAARHTAFYRRFYAGKDVADFASLPVLRKAVVRDVSPYEFLSDAHAKDVVWYGETTGSSGSPTPSFLTRKEFHGATLLAHLSPGYPALAAAIRENRTCVNGLAFGFTIAGMSFADVLVNLGGCVANVGSRSTLATPERIARALARLRPSVVAATPTDFLCWMRILREDHPAAYPEVVARLKVLVSTAELCADSRSRAIAKEFDLLHVDTYACVEGFFTLACPCGEKHVLDAYHVELFDDDLAPLGRTGRGRLAFTNLVKESTPLVRYLLDDDATLFDSTCRFGFTRSVVPHGRHELCARLPDRRLNVREVEEAIFSVGLFGDYAVDLFDDRVEARVEAYAAGTEGAKAAVEQALSAAVGLPARVEIVPFATLVAYREPRRSKSILRLRDRRAVSAQRVPEYV
jgi:phenylacetate-CoA ligase